MTRLVILLTAMLVLGPPVIDAATNARIVMLGDSLSARGDWARLLDRADVVNHGVDGDTIRGVTRRVERVARLAPEYVFVMVGINDLIAGRSPAACVHDMRVLRERLRDGVPDATLIVQSVLSVGASLTRLTPRIDELNRGLRELCADGGCAFLDVARAVTLEGLSRDDLHLAAVGYRAWAEVVKRELAVRDN